MTIDTANLSAPALKPTLALRLIACADLVFSLLHVVGALVNGQTALATVDPWLMFVAGMGALLNLGFVAAGLKIDLPLLEGKRSAMAHARVYAIIAIIVRPLLLLDYVTKDSLHMEPMMAWAPVLILLLIVVAWNLWYYRVVTTTMHRQDAADQDAVQD